MAGDKSQHDGADAESKNRNRDDKRSVDEDSFELPDFYIEGDEGWTEESVAFDSDVEQLTDGESPESQKVSESVLGALLGGVSELSSQAVRFAARKTWETSSKVLKSSPEQMEMIGRAGSSLKDLREVAGVSREELANFIDLKDADLLKAAEEGKAGLPFEVLLRLSSFYARNDPIPFIMKYSKVYSPRIWKLLRSVGLEGLVVQAERELQFVQIYRAKDEARKLSDEEFAEVLAFTRQAFDMALHFVASQQQRQQASDHSGDEGQGSES